VGTLDLRAASVSGANTMDAFELDEAKRRLLQQRIIPVWIEFRTSVRSLIESYNRTPKGQGRGAKLELAHDDRVLIVTSIGEIAEDQFSFITVSIRAAIHEGNFQIEAATEKWLTRRAKGAPPMERVGWTEYLFQLEGDPATGDSWLIRQETRRSAFQCAEFLLFEALA
jgi:hypothetical protein